ncbi:helix-hairpin-helix domain-containing protein [Leisingera sp. ANG59]|uniref:helix-hairpin-helix domain-containing protein n=1 Tax=Leisingera sp. ANG59 TaxID=2675221 RepID=UPI0015719E91|nr:helix-hairpin-helix domain-containing protein [Leisingera sp. ANG59]
MTSALAEVMATSLDFYGIGPARAARLDAHFGEGLRDALSDCDPAVANILGDEVAEIAFAAFKARAAELDLLDWLQHRGIVAVVGVPTARKIALAWGVGGVQALAENPYLLGAFLPWSVTDRVCIALGFDKEDPRRVVAAAEAALYARLDENHTAADFDTAALSVGKLLAGSETTGEQAIRRAVEAEALIAYRDVVQPMGAAAMEAFLAQELTRLGREAPVTDLALPGISPEDLEAAVERYANTIPFAPTRPQRKAVNERSKLTRFQRLNLTHPLWRKGPRRTRYRRAARLGPLLARRLCFSASLALCEPV